MTIEVTIPQIYKDTPTLFAYTLLSARLTPPQVDTRVIINERKQIFIVGADVEIGPVAVMHKNRLIQVAGNDQPVNEAVAFSPRGDTTKPKWGLVENPSADCKIPALPSFDSLTANPKLPDPFTKMDGTRITDRSAWRCRRSCPCCGIDQE